MATAAAEKSPLPTLLGLLTLVTGFVDAVTYLQFGHVFVANMTGNIIFLGFGLAGAPDISILGSLVALAAFLFGALIGGAFNQRLGERRGKLLAWSAVAKVLLLLTATIAALLHVSAYGIIPELGIAMGIQNAVARKIAIADITTTVLTMTLTGLMADSSLVGGSNPRFVRRVLAVVTMFVGALAGAAIVLHFGVAPALAVATLIVLLVSGAAFASDRVDFHANAAR